ncbi:hypothetical protein M0805_009787 [Coniferiporia weirii]|nr:hypothetical protein M0805_009787 [Coniferiporia weirii]
MPLQLYHEDPLTAAAAQYASEEPYIQLAQYLVIAALAAVIWQMVLSIAQDVEIIGQGVSLFSILYFTSRSLPSLSSRCRKQRNTDILGALTVNPGPQTPCGYLLSAQAWLFALTMCATSFLFFFRIRAVFMGNRIMSAVFLLMWLGVLGSCAYSPFSVTAGTNSAFFTGSAGAQSAVTRLLRGRELMKTCTVDTMQVECVICFIATAAYDTVVFLTVSWRLLSIGEADGGCFSRLKYLFGRKSLPVIYGIIFESGQRYYAVAICGHLTAIAIMHAPGVPRAVCVALTVPYLIVNNTMACKIFREVRASLDGPPSGLRDGRDGDGGSECTSTAFSSIVFDNRDLCSNAES